MGGSDTACADVRAECAGCAPELLCGISREMNGYGVPLRYGALSLCAVKMTNGKGGSPDSRFTLLTDRQFHRAGIFTGVSGASVPRYTAERYPHENSNGSLCGGSDIHN